VKTNMKTIRNVLFEEGFSCSRIDEIMSKLDQSLQQTGEQTEMPYLELSNGERVTVGEFVYTDHCCTYVVSRFHPLTVWFIYDGPLGS